MRVDMGYIKVILLVNIGLTFSYEIIDSEYLDEEIENPSKKIEYLNEENAKDILDNISDEYLDKIIINLPDKVYPKHYKVHLTVNTKSAYPTISLSGQVDINVTINSNNTIRTLLLHAKNIELNNVYTMLRNAKGIHYVNESYTIQEEILAINFMSKVPPDNYILTIVFNSTANDSFIRNKLPDEHATKKRRKNAYSDLILTHFRETATRQLFPCWDEPTYKATFDIEITHEAEYTVLSNMPISEISDADNDQPNMKCTKFITTPMMSTHQLVILLEPSKLIVDPRETIHTWRKSDRTSIISYMHNIVNDTLKYLLEYTNTTLYNQKIDHLLIPNASYSKAQLGLIIYRESDVIYDENIDSISIKSEVMTTIESQVAHQWFGGLVTPKFWNHSWLTESFALYFSHYSSKQAKLWKEILKWNSERFEKAVQLKIVENYHDVMRKDTKGSIPRVLSASLRIYSNHVYHKGAFILRMLSGMFTEAKFREIVIKYLHKHKFGVVTSDDLWSILHNIKDSEDDLKFIFSEVKNIKEVMEPWITQKGFPIVEVWRNSNDDLLRLTQKSSFQPLFDKKNRKWWIPITYMTSTDAILSNLTFRFKWLKPTESLQLQFTNVLKNNDSWYIINVGQIGYYRVHYDRENWKRLGHFLKSKNYSRIPVLNRAQLINDICDKYRNNETDWDLFEHITSYLSQEVDYIPWVPMVKCLDMLKKFFQLPESKWYQMHIANYFNLIFNEIGYEDLKDDDIRKKARQNLAFYACTLGNPTCRNAAVDKLKKHLADPITYEIMPWWQNWTFCFGLKTEDTSLWFQMYQLYANTKKKTILYSLPCIEDPDIIIQFLHKLVENNTIIEKADQAKLFYTIIKQHISNDQILSYIMNNIKIIKPEPCFLSVVFDTIVTNIYSDEQLDKFLQLIKTTTDDDDIYKAYQMTVMQQRQKIKALRKDIHMKFPDRNKPNYKK